MAEVVYVHGLWMPGDESLILRHRLAQEFGLALHPFRYSAASSSMLAIAERLDQFVRELEAPVVHLVGHSLGAWSSTASSSASRSSPKGGRCSSAPLVSRAARQ